MATKTEKAPENKERLDAEKAGFRTTPPDPVVTYFQPVTQAQAIAAAHAEHAMMVVHGTGNFVTRAMQNSAPGP